MTRKIKLDWGKESPRSANIKNGSYNAAKQHYDSHRIRSKTQTSAAVTYTYDATNQPLPTRRGSAGSKFIYLNGKWQPLINSDNKEQCERDIFNLDWPSHPENPDNHPRHNGQVKKKFWSKIWSKLTGTSKTVTAEKKQAFILPRRW